MRFLSRIDSPKRKPSYLEVENFVAENNLSKLLLPFGQLQYGDLKINKPQQWDSYQKNFPLVCRVTKCNKIKQKPNILFLQNQQHIKKKLLLSIQKNTF